jgi:hypothetical protein
LALKELNPIFSARTVAELHGWLTDNA